MKKIGYLTVYFAFTLFMHPALCAADGDGPPDASQLEWAINVIMTSSNQALQPLTHIFDDIADSFNNFWLKWTGESLIDPEENYPQDYLETKRPAPLIIPEDTQDLTDISGFMRDMHEMCEELGNDRFYHDTLEQSQQEAVHFIAQYTRRTTALNLLAGGGGAFILSSLWPENACLLLCDAGTRFTGIVEMAAISGALKGAGTALKPFLPSVITLIIICVAWKTIKRLMTGELEQRHRNEIANFQRDLRDHRTQTQRQLRGHQTQTQQRLSSMQKALHAKEHEITQELSRQKTWVAKKLTEINTKNNEAEQLVRQAQQNMGTQTAATARQIQSLEQLARNLPDVQKELTQLKQTSKKQQVYVMQTMAQVLEAVQKNHIPAEEFTSLQQAISPPTPKSRFALPKIPTLRRKKNNDPQASPDALTERSQSTTSLFGSPSPQAFGGSPLSAQTPRFGRNRAHTFSSSAHPCSSLVSPPPYYSAASSSSSSSSFPHAASQPNTPCSLVRSPIKSPVHFTYDVQPGAAPCSLPTIQSAAPSRLPSPSGDSNNS